MAAAFVFLNHENLKPLPKIRFTSPRVSRYLPPVSAETTLLEQGDGAPSDFGNESPFKKKSKPKDPMGNALKFAGIFGLALCIAAAAMASFTL